MQAEQRLDRGRFLDQTGESRGVDEIAHGGRYWWLIWPFRGVIVKKMKFQHSKQGFENW